MDKFEPVADLGSGNFGVAKVGRALRDFCNICLLFALSVPGFQRGPCPCPFIMSSAQAIARFLRLFHFQLMRDRASGQLVSLVRFGAGSGAFMLHNIMRPPLCLAQPLKFHATACRSPSSSLSAASG